jgi:hypothetical protein
MPRKKQSVALSKCQCGNGLVEIGESFLDDLVEIRCTNCGRTTGELEGREAAVAARNARTAEELTDAT